MTDYAIVEHGGKQYRVSPGDELLVERTETGLGAGDNLLFENVILLSKDDDLRIRLMIFLYIRSRV